MQLLKKLILLTLSFLLLTSYYSPITRMVAQGRWSAHWQVDVDFNNNNVDATLRVYIENEQGSLPEISLPLHCITHGNLTINEQQATFYGNEYIECNMPSIIDIVYNATNGAFILHPYCICEKTPWAEGLLQSEAISTLPEPIYPIFYRSDLQLSVFDDGSGKGLLEFQVDQIQAESDLFPITGNMQEIRAIYEFVTTNVYEPSFIVDSQALASNPAMIHNQLMLSNKESTIYIGYSPDTNIYFEGVLQKLRIDPGCFGRD